MMAKKEANNLVNKQLETEPSLSRKNSAATKIQAGYKGMMTRKSLEGNNEKILENEIQSVDSLSSESFGETITNVYDGDMQPQQVHSGVWKITVHKAENLVDKDFAGKS